MQKEQRTDLGGFRLVKPIGNALVAGNVIGLTLLAWGPGPHWKVPGALLVGLCGGLLSARWMAIWTRDARPEGGDGGEPLKDSSNAW